MLGANGGVYALRRTDYTPIPARTIVDDFWISMEIIESGRRCVYDPEAVATEEIPARIGDEFRRRVRIGIGNYQAFGRFIRMLDPRRGWVALSFLSHKCLRWLVPHFMLTALACNVLLFGPRLLRCAFDRATAFLLWCLGRLALCAKRDGAQVAEDSFVLRQHESGPAGGVLEIRHRRGFRGLGAQREITPKLGREARDQASKSRRP